MNYSFNGQVALVTGATRGIGKQIAEDLLDSGATLILTGKNRERIRALETFLPETIRSRVTYYKVDFTDNSQIKKFLNTAG